MFFLSLVGLVILASRGDGTEVIVEVRKDMGEGTHIVVDTFRYSKPFVRTSAHVPWGGIRGFLWVTSSKRRVPSDPSRANASWIFVVPEPSEDEAFELLNGARWTTLLILLNPNNTYYLRISPFPTVLVDRAAIEFLLAQPPDETVILHVRTSSTFEAVTVAICGLGLVCLCASVCLTWACCRHRREIPPSAHDALSRHRPAQGLQESIRRHIRQLQAEDPNQIQVPLRPALLLQLPVTRFKRRTGNCDVSCAVCMNEFRTWQKVRTLTCRHFFHMACIDEWLINYSSLCPLCKNPAIDCPMESSFSTGASIQEEEVVGGGESQMLSPSRRGGPKYGSMVVGAAI